jgi:hypothetical protein
MSQTQQYVFKSVLNRKPKVQVDSLVRNKNQYAFKSVLKRKQNQNKDTTIDSIFKGLTELEYNGETGLTERTNNPVATLWTQELAEKFGATKGPPLPPADNPEGRELYTAIFPSKELGEQGGKFVIKNIYNNVGGNLESFSSIYPMGLKTDQLITDRQIAIKDRYFKTLSKYMGKNDYNNVIESRENNIGAAVVEEASRIRQTGNAYNDILDSIDIFSPTRTSKSNKPFYERFPVDNNKQVTEPKDSMLLKDIEDSKISLNTVDDVKPEDELENQVKFYQSKYSLSQYREPTGVNAFKTMVQDTFGGESPNEYTTRQLAVNALKNVGDVLYGVSDFKDQVVDFVMMGKGGKELAESILTGYAAIPELASDLMLASLKPVANSYPEEQRKFINDAYDRWFQSPLNAPLVAVGLKAGGVNAKGIAKAASNKTKDLTQYSRAALEIAKGNKDKINVNYTTKTLAENIKNPQVLQEVLDIVDKKNIKATPLKTAATKKQIQEAKVTISDLADNITQQKSLLDNPNVSRPLTGNQRQQIIKSIENASKIIEEQLVILGDDAAAINSLKSSYGLSTAQGKVFIDFVKQMGKGAKESALALLDKPIISTIMGRQTGSIFDETQPVPKRFEKTKKFLEETNQANKVELGMNLGTFSKIKGKFLKATVDVGAEVNLIIDKAIKTAGGEESAMLKAIRIEKDLINGYNTQAAMKIEQLNSTIYNQLSRKETKMLDALILLRNESGLKKFHIDEIANLKNKRKTETSKPELRKIDEEIKRMENYEYSGGKGTATYDGVVDDMLASLPDDVRGKINSLADDYFAVFKEAVDELEAAGLIDDVSAAQFKRREYMPKKYLEFIRGEKDYTIRNKKITVHDNGIKRLKTGDAGFLFKNSKILLYDFITSSKNRIARNNADTALNSLLKTKKGGYEGIGYRLKDGNTRLKKGYTRIEFFEKGRKKYIALEDEFASGWVVSDPVAGPRLMNAMGWMSGSKIIKATATGYNPVFAVTNMARDMAFITLNEHGAYSNFLPYAYVQMARDMVRVSRDVRTKSGRYTDFVNEGGGFALLSKPLRPDAFSGKIGNSLQFLDRYLGKIGEYSELSTRLAFRDRLIKNGVSPKEATWRARSYMDFSKNGQISRAMEAFIPYANANIQATRGMLRGMKDKRWWVKAAQIAAMKYGAYQWATSSKENKEIYDRISDTQKFSNLIIPIPLRTENPKTGESKPLAVKIPLDSGQQLIGGIMESAFAYQERKRLPDYHYEQMFKIIESLAPLDIGRLSPTINVTISLYTGKRFPYKTDIYLGGEKNVEESLKTNFNEENAYKDIASFFNASPAKVKYTMEKFIARGNTYYDIGLGAYDKMRKLMTEEDLYEYDRNAAKYIGVPALDSPVMRTLRDRIFVFPEDKSYTEKEKAIELDKERNSIRTEMNNELVLAALAIVNNKDNPEKQQQIHTAVVNRLEEYRAEYGQEEYANRVKYYTEKLSKNTLTLTKGLVEIAANFTPRQRAYFLARFVTMYPQDDERYNNILNDLKKISPVNKRTGKATGFLNEETKQEFQILMDSFYENGVLSEPFPFKK